MSVERDEARTSLSLLERLRGEDPQAWQTVCRVYAPLIYTWCRSDGVSPQDAEDILQEVFGILHRSLDTFEPRSNGSFRGWLRTITRNRVRDHFRRLGAGPLVAGGSTANAMLHQHAEPSATADPEPISANPQLLRSLDYVRAEFREKTWLAFWMSTAEGRATADVAADLEMTEGAVRKARFRVLRRLREELDGLI